MLRPRKQQGLTLVEMLVVIVLVSLVATLLVQGLGNAMALYQRISSEQYRRHHEAMVLGWFRDVVSAAVPNRVGEQHFQGKSGSLSLASFQPLLSEQAINSDLAWSISPDAPYTLKYQEAGKRITLPLNTSQRPFFEYLDEARRWHPRWPLTQGSDRLPRAVRLSLGGRLITVVVRAHRQPHFYADELLHGRE